MDKAANQRNIAVNKESADQYNLYAKINLEALETAMQVLSPNAFKIWIYFAKNQKATHLIYLLQIY